MRTVVRHSANGSLDGLNPIATTITVFINYPIQRNTIRPHARRQEVRSVKEQSLCIVYLLRENHFLRSPSPSYPLG